MKYKWLIDAISYRDLGFKDVEEDDNKEGKESEYTRGEEKRYITTYIRNSAESISLMAILESIHMGFLRGQKCCIIHGKKVYDEHLRRIDEEIVKRACVTMLDGIKAIFVLPGLNASEIALRALDTIGKELNITLAFTIFKPMDDQNKYVCSLRSKNGEALQIAKKYGGGGHRDAAAFTVKVENSNELLSYIKNNIEIGNEKLVIDEDKMNGINNI